MAKRMVPRFGGGRAGLLSTEFEHFQNEMDPIAVFLVTSNWLNETDLASCGHTLTSPI